MQDIVNKDVDEEEVLEMLIDAKRIIDLMGQELNNYINNNYINNNYINNNYINNNYINNKKNQGT